MFIEISGHNTIWVPRYTFTSLTSILGHRQNAGIDLDYFERCKDEIIMHQQQSILIIPLTALIDQS